MANLKNNKLLACLYYAVVVVLLLVGALVAFSALPIKGNYEIKTVRSGSMSPEIRRGSVVVVKPAESYQAGDVITFGSNFKDVRGRKLDVTHRVVEVVEGEEGVRYVVKGDANDEADTRQVAAGEVVGKVMLSVPLVGFAVETARTPAGFVGILVVPALVIIYGEVMNIWREVKAARGRRRAGNGGIV